MLARMRARRAAPRAWPRVRWTGEAGAAEPGARGAGIGGSGPGELIAANNGVGVRAALAWNLETARLGRQHNDANVVAVGARQHSVDEAVALVDAFLAEPFSGDPRHQRRIDQLAASEAARGPSA